MTHAKSGFTLAELLIALLIMGLLAAVGIPTYIGLQQRAKNQTTTASLRALSQAIDDYHMAFNNYPKRLEDLVKPPKGGQSFLKGSKVPQDGWGNDFSYKTPGKGHPYDLYSYGSSGPEEATEEEFISVWEL